MPAEINVPAKAGAAPQTLLSLLTRPYSRPVGRAQLFVKACELMEGIAYINGSYQAQHAFMPA